MKKLFALILALCQLALAIPALAEDPVIVKDSFKLTFVTADFRENWA